MTATPHAVAAQPAARISVRDNWWIAIPIVAIIAAIRSHEFLFLNYVHVITAILWTGTDIFMGFILGPILRKVDVPTRRNIIGQLMPRMLFYMPTMAGVTTTAGIYMADWLGLFQLPYPQMYWVIGALVIVGIMTIQGMGVLLPINLRVFFELRKEKPRVEMVQRLMRIYVMVVASQAFLQFTIIFIMNKFRSGL